MDKAKKCKRINGFEVCRKDGATRQKQQYEIKSGEAIKGKDCKTKCMQITVIPSNIPYDWDKRKKDKYCQVTYKDMDDAKRTYAEWLENERRRAIISLVVAAICEEAPILYGDDFVTFSINCVKNNYKCLIFLNGTSIEWKVDTS